MKEWLERAKDPLLHVLVVVLAVVVLVFGSESWSSSRPVAQHPADCHTCSLRTPGAAEARDAFLVRHGYIDAEDCVGVR